MRLCFLSGSPCVPGKSDVTFRWISAQEKEVENTPVALKISSAIPQGRRSHQGAV